jgi:hypothetical protein
LRTRAETLDVCGKRAIGSKQGSELFGCKQRIAI